MQIVRQRNPYLKQVQFKTPHKYSYDLTTGKHYLLQIEGRKTEINKTGKSKPTFKQNITGFFNSKERQAFSQKEDSSAMFELPCFKRNTNSAYVNIMPDKFAGYAQFPYKIKQFPSHLQLQAQASKRYSQSKQNLKRQLQHSKSKSIGIKSMKLIKNENNFFRLSIESMKSTIQFPKNPKKDCYNLKCRQKITISHLNTENSTQPSLPSKHSTTYGKSYYQEKLQNQTKQLMLIKFMK